MNQDITLQQDNGDSMKATSGTLSSAVLAPIILGTLSLLVVIAAWLNSDNAGLSLGLLCAITPLSIWLSKSSSALIIEQKIAMPTYAVLNGLISAAFVLSVQSIVVKGWLSVDAAISLHPVSVGILCIILVSTWGILLSSFQLRKTLFALSSSHRMIYYMISAGLFGVLSFYSIQSSLVFFVCLLIFYLLLDLFADVPQASLVWLVVWTIVIGTFLALLIINFQNSLLPSRLPLINGFSLFSIIFLLSIAIDVAIGLANKSNRLLPKEWDFNFRQRRQLRNRIQLSILLTLLFSFAAIIAVAIYQYKVLHPDGVGFELSSTFVQSLLNTSVFLFLLGFVISVSLSNYIRTPLVELGKTLKAVKLIKANKKIDWNSNDEIGTLIEEYNQMIEKLQENVNLLAQTERDNAWREMAKQVAHEIKNPLTPMKLSLQHLQRTISSKRADAMDITMRMCETLMNQVDNLSQIADEFSNFGSLPKTNNNKVLLNDIVETIHDLFRKRGDMDIHLIEPIDDIEVHADKNHLVRVLNNLVKNSIQAIPSDRKGHIELKLWKEENKAIISVRDNGIGIKDDMKSRIFKPRFTTKTSGSGLGLAIASNMVDSMGGTIFFESESEVGTSFYVELPLIRSEFATSMERVALD